MNISGPDCQPSPRYTNQLLLTETDTRAGDAAAIVGQIAHELRQPLSAMEAIVYYLHLTVADDPRTRAQIDKLRQLIEQSGSILSDAVHYLQAAPARPERRDLHETLAECLSRLATLDQNLIALDLADPFPLINFDLTQMHHLIATALRFCFRASRRAHPVEITTHVEAQHAIVSFSTLAPHLDIPSPEGLFTPFEEHPAAAAGLGLASVRRISETHGGACRLLAGPDSRLTLRVELPL
jgi:signal transduction histidine kinase